MIVFSVIISINRPQGFVNSHEEFLGQKEPLTLTKITEYSIMLMVEIWAFCNNLHVRKAQDHH
jgi:hypothetical protein